MSRCQNWTPGRNGAISILAKAKGDPNYENHHGDTALHVAARAANPLGKLFLVYNEPCKREHL